MKESPVTFNEQFRWLPSSSSLTVAADAGTVDDAIILTEVDNLLLLLCTCVHGQMGGFGLSTQIDDADVLHNNSITPIK